ncbi:Histone-lysine n-methyltransferase setd3, partial [Thalictrum thalictroides]
HLTPDNILPEINSLLSNVVGDVSRLAIVVLMEQRKGQASEWDPYISSLPHAGELHSTLFWSKEELEMIHQSSVYEETISQKAQLKKEYLTLRPALDQFPIFFKDTTFEDFLHAFVLVASRAWGSSKAVSLVPFADFLNHDGDSEALLLIDEDKQISEVIADQDYTPGKQVLVSYGKYPNSTLLLDFGFTLSYNNCDQVQIQMVSPQHDPLRNLKLELVHKLSTPVVTDSCSIDSFRNSFIIKEVRSTRGKGKGIPQPLRAFARILCTDTLEELRDLELEALQTDGRLARRPLKNMSREIQSHQLLLSRITHLIQDYDASVKEARVYLIRKKVEKLKWPSRRITLLTISLTRLTRMVSRSLGTTGTLQPKGWIQSF